MKRTYSNETPVQFHFFGDEGTKKPTNEGSLSRILDTEEIRRIFTIFGLRDFIEKKSQQIVFLKHVSFESIINNLINKFWSVEYRNYHPAKRDYSINIK